MASAPPNPTQLTPPRVAVIDERTGAISREWYRFFLSLLTSSQATTAATETQPDANSLMATYDAMLGSLTQEVQTNTSDLTASLQQQINDVFNATAVTPPSSGGTVTSVDASGGSTGMVFTGGPITTSGTLTLSGTLNVVNGGTGQTSYTDGQLLIGNTTGNTLTKATLTAGTAISITNGAGSITITNTAPDQIVSLTAGTGISISGTYPSFTITNTAPDQIVSLTGAGTTVVTGTYPNFTITSNDQYVGTVTSVSGTGTVNGITLTGTVTSSGSLTLGGTLGGIANSQLTNSSITINGSAISLGGSVSVGTVTSVGGTGTVNGITLTGTVTSSGSLTLGGTLSGVSLTSQVTGTLPVGNGGTGNTTLTADRILKGNGTSAITYSIIYDVSSYVYIGAGNGGGIMRIYDSQTGGGGKCISTYDYLNYTAMQFIRDNGNPANVVGTITCTDTATAYNTSSDRRLKTNIAPADDAAAIIDAIEVVKYDWKSNGETVPFGVVAQDLQKVVPLAVHTGDASEDAPIEDVWSVDYSKLVPVMLKELQSLRARVAQLEG